MFFGFYWIIIYYIRYFFLTIQFTNERKIIMDAKKISQQFSPELKAQLEEAFKLQIENGSSSVILFRQALNHVIQEFAPTSKGLMSTAVSGLKDELKSHFCRGRKWVSILEDSDLYETAVNLARSKGYDDLVELWESHGHAWVRFHSASNVGANFSIHPNSSVGSNVKFSVPSETALQFEPITGTPKQQGWEQMGYHKKTEVQPEPEETEVEETENPETLEDINFDEIAAAELEIEDL